MIAKTINRYTREHRAKQRMRVVMAIANSHAGLTSDECEMRLRMPHQTVSPRFTELRASGAIKWAGKTRTTMQGRAAKVYKVTDDGFWLAASNAKTK